MPYVLAVLAAAVLFGTTGTSQALGPGDTTPLSVGVIRLVIGGALLAVVGSIASSVLRSRARSAGHPRTGSPRWSGRAVTAMAITGVALAAYQPLFFFGTARNGVAVGTVVALGSAPVLAGLLEWALTRRVPGGTWIAATALATVGVGMLGAGGGGSTGAGATDALGLLGSVGAGASFAVIANVQRRLIEAGWTPFTVVGAMGGFSAVIAAFALPFVDLSWVLTPRGAAVAAWLAVATLVAAYALFTWGLTGLTAATAATLTLGEPLTAALLGIFVLGERLSAIATVGVCVLAAALALLAWGSRSRDAASGTVPTSDLNSR